MSEKQSNYRSRMLFILEMLFLLIFLIAAFELGKMAYDYHKGDQLYDTVSEEYVSETSSGTPAQDNTINLGVSIDHAGLKVANPDTLGWILIPDTPVNYPLMAPDNNNYYLKHTFTRSYSDFGSIFLAAECKPDLTDPHILIYGHNTKNGSMFGSLKKYKDATYAKAHPYIYILQDNRVLEYKIVSCFTAETSDDIYLLSFENEQSRFYWLQSVVALSVVDFGYHNVTGQEQMLTLSTCTSRTKTERFVVNAIYNRTFDGVK